MKFKHPLGGLYFEYEDVNGERFIKTSFTEDDGSEDGVFRGRTFKDTDVFLQYIVSILNDIPEPPVEMCECNSTLWDKAKRLIKTVGKCISMSKNIFMWRYQCQYNHKTSPTNA